MKEPGPLVSVVMPCHDDYDWIERSVRSVLAQTYPRWELIVVDDGSPSVPEAFTRKFLARSRVRLLRQRRSGAASARNTGIEAADGKFVAFLDADDRWRTTKLEVSLEPLTEDDGVVMVYTSFATETPEGERLTLRKPSDFGREGFVRRFYVSGEGILPSTAVVRTEAIRAIGGFDEGLRRAHDRDCWVRLARTGRMFFVNDPLTTKVVRGDSLSGSGRYRHEKRVARKLAGAYPELADLLGKRMARIRSAGGYRQLERGRWRNASLLFCAALRDDHRCVLAYAGLGLVPVVAVLGGGIVRAARRVRVWWRWIR